MEYVLVTPAALLRRLGHFQGFCFTPERYLPELLAPRNWSFRPRAEMELDPGFKQLIPYVVAQVAAEPGAPPGRREVFHYTRGGGQGETRLHRRRSVGVGGHISVVDAAAELAGAYEAGLRRELDEEVALEAPYTLRCVGLINDDETPVGRVHLGVVHLLEIAAPRVVPREADLLDSGFAPAEKLLADLANFETWSQICLEALYGPSSPGDLSR